MASNFPRKIKIVYDRNGCIGAAACASINPADWVMDSDGKANLTNSSKEAEKFVKVVDVQDEQGMSRIVESATVCPVSIIEIWDVNENKKIFPAG